MQRLMMMRCGAVRCGVWGLWICPRISLALRIQSPSCYHLIIPRSSKLRSHVPMSSDAPKGRISALASTFVPGGVPAGGDSKPLSPTMSAEAVVNAAPFVPGNDGIDAPNGPP